MKWSATAVQSTFPPTRRPIYVYPIAAMSRKNREQAYPQIAEAVRKIVEKNANEKGLVHSVSYDLTKYLASEVTTISSSSSPLICTYQSSKDREKQIHTFKNSTVGAVLIAPALDRGIDLPQDTCRYIIVCKLPFPNLATKQISARLHSKGGQLWYNVRTVRSLVQMTGRGMRSADDYCQSYILDKQFLTLIWRRNRQLLPEWWRQALVWNGPKL